MPFLAEVILSFIRIAANFRKTNAFNVNNRALVTFSCRFFLELVTKQLLMFTLISVDTVKLYVRATILTQTHARTY